MIQTLVSIAAAHESSISSEELFLLLPRGAFASAAELESFVGYDLPLREELLVRDGEITLKGSEPLVRGRVEQVNLSAQRSELARSFSDRLVGLCPWIRLVAISGSTAYARTRPHDDVDFYLVTRRNRLWLTLLFAMLAARFHRMRDSNSPQFCFNRILEEKECRDAFRSTQEPLFAREALNLCILEGRAYYRELLDSARWMEDIFPALFRRALATPAISYPVGDHADGRVLSIVNGIVFAALAPYLAIIGLWRNNRLLRAGNLDARFRTMIRRGFFAYESRKYDLLTETYQKVF